MIHHKKYWTNIHVQTENSDRKIIDNKTDRERGRGERQKRERESKMKEGKGEDTKTTLPKH